MSTVEEIDLSTVIRQRGGLLAHDVDGTLVVADETSSCWYGLELIARKIWQLVERPQKVTDLCTALVNEYNIDRESCERDVLDFLGELKREGLIEIV